MNLNQTVRSLVLRTSAGDQLIACDSDGCTPQRDGIDYIVGSHPFDVKVVITSASSGDEGIFTATISALSPETLEVDEISKTFTVLSVQQPLTSITAISSSATGIFTVTCTCGAYCVIQKLLFLSPTVVSVMIMPTSFWIGKDNETIPQWWSEMVLHNDNNEMLWIVIAKFDRISSVSTTLDPCGINFR